MSATHNANVAITRGGVANLHLLWGQLGMWNRCFWSNAPLVSLTLMFVWGCNRADQNRSPQQRTVAVAFAQRGNISHVLSVAGQFQPYQVIDVHAKVSGYVRDILVDIGDRVHAGQALATLEVPELNAQYRGTESEALRAQDSITAAQHELSRAQALHVAVQANYDRLSQAAAQRPGLIAQQELDDARAQAQATQEQIDTAQSQLAAAKETALVAANDQQRVGALQSYTRITAPLTGVVVWRYADTGVLLQQGTNSSTQSLPLIKLAQSDLLRLRVPVPEDAVRYVHQGDAMQIRVAALDRAFSGTIVRFTRNLDPTTRTMETEVDVPNADLAITPGMYANAYLQLAHRENVVTIPVTALQGTGTAGTIFVLGEKDELQQRTVQIGLRGSRLVEVTAGLQPGDRVVLGDVSLLQNGEHVKPVIQPEPASDIMHEEGGVTDPNETSGGGQ
jgi:RND family efflux transporter MFP subunit